MSEDEDYMSDKFLQGVEKIAAPSLIHRHADKRELELLKKKVEMQAKLKGRKSLKVTEEEKREEGLSVAISNDNKGFEMLMKMGYKPGQGLGKMGSGISEPIAVNVKANRSGLGEKPKVKRTHIKNPNKKLDNLGTDDFRGRIAQKRIEHLIETDMYKSQKVCQQLDEQREIEKPNETWYWPTTIKQTNESDDDTDSEEEEEECETLTTKEKLEILTKYLREKYFYCIWCGVTYENEDDLRDNCPGKTRDDH